MGCSNPQVSVIMPVCNMDSYVGRAITSMQNQTLADIEILVVDDGSADRSGEIAERMAETDIRIEVYHTANAGASAALNLALDHAHGEFVFFCDADGWAEPGMLEDMVETARAYPGCEFVVAGFYVDTYYGNKGEYVRETKSRPARAYGSQDEFRRDAFELFDQSQLYAPWSKLFLRSRIEELGLRFQETFMDGFPFVLGYIRDVEKVCVVERAYYHFTRNRTELQFSRWRPDLYERCEEEHDRMLDLIEHWGLSTEPKTLEMVQRRYIERLTGCIENVCSKACTLPVREKIRQIKAMIETDRAQLAVRVARPKSRVMAAMFAPIRARNALACYAEGRIISAVKAHDAKASVPRKARR